MNLVKRAGFILGPLLFISILLTDAGHTPLATKVLAVAAWMLVWWLTEALPIFITAMLPMVLFPALGIMPLKETFMPYGSPIVFLFLGGFIIALAMEERKLHERIAYGLVRLTGTDLRGVVFGFMMATALVAMWISNTATAVMMLPIALSVIALVAKQADEATAARFSLLLLLGIAYAANIGGTITLIGTPPNLVFAGYYFDAFGEEFSFARWLKFGIPIGVGLLLLTYLLLTSVIFPIRERKVKGVQELFDAKWAALGPMQLPEKLVLVVFSLTVFCWVFSTQINEVLGASVLNNTNIAMAGGLLMFMVPVSWKRGEFLLDWKSTQRLPWGILILFGGGLALAGGLEHAGIIHLVGEWVADNAGTSPFMLCLGLTVVALFATEVMSNVALVTVLLPVVLGIAEGTGIEVTYLAIPVTLAASCAFMMPISTPPNAVVFASGHITVGQMARAGIWVNLLAVALIVGAMQILSGP
jgi:solute carrier family 13 (sodium-dependent dicarboxylate transporter), member 2/3/5